MISFNLRNMRSKDGVNGWEHRRELVAEIFRKYNPDIVGTQEGYWQQIEQLQSLVPNYGHIGVGRDDGEREGETCAIFYKRTLEAPVRTGTFWFSDSPKVPGSRHPECSHPRICTWAAFIPTSSTPFTVYNVHLDHESQSARMVSVEMLVERMNTADSSDPVIALGDFNMAPDNPAYLTLVGGSSPPLYDSFAILNRNQTDDGTFHNFTGRSDLGRIDYIFTSPGLKVIQSGIIPDDFNGRYPSDHFPIFAKLEIIV